MDASDRNRLLTPREAWELLGVSESTLARITVPRGTLPVVRVGRLRRYSMADVLAWIEANKQR